MTVIHDRELSVIAISTSESPDMEALGLSGGHLRNATAEIAAHVLACGANLAYGGDLREDGFTELLFELVMRYRREGQTADAPRVTNYMAWPVHIQMTTDELNTTADELSNTAMLVLIGQDGGRLALEERQALVVCEPDEDEWSNGLTTMRQLMRDETDARILLGGRVDGYMGCMPGIAEEALLSLQAGQPVFLLGGFGGCARDIAETLMLVDPWNGSRPEWPGRAEFQHFRPESLRNGLSAEENLVLARTPYVDQAVTLILRGLNKLRNSGDNFTPEWEESDGP